MVKLVTCGVRPVAAAGGARAECAVADFDRTYGVGRIGRIFIDEFVATGTGGYYLTDKKEVIVISMGTGSFFVKVTENEMKHLGGVGLGGGTICGLSSIILKPADQTI